MLPDRSKRYAGLNGELPRLYLISYPGLAGFALAMLAFLALVFPKGELVERLSHQRQLNDLSTSYLNILLQTTPEDSRIRLLLAKNLSASPRWAQVADILAPLSQSDDADQAKIIVVHAEAHGLDYGHLDAQSQRELRGELIANLRQLLDRHLPAAELERLAIVALRVGDTNTALSLIRRMQQENLPVSNTWLIEAANQALAIGEYRTSADYLFIARDQALNRDDARRLFIKGIQTLMADSLFAQAMDAAERHIGDLANDPETLRYLTRTAQAAGYPAKAEGYAKRLIGLDGRSERAALP